MAAPRYQGAVDDFSSELKSRGIGLDDLTEEQLDYILPAHVIDLFDLHGGQGIDRKSVV